MSIVNTYAPMHTTWSGAIVHPTNTRVLELWMGKLCTPKHLEKIGLKTTIPIAKRVHNSNERIEESTAA